MDALSLVLRAVSDPTRRTILDLLAEESRSVNDLAQHFSTSRPAVSKHLGILREAKLVTSRRDGRQQIYERSAGGLAPVRDWLQQQAPAERSRQTVAAAAPRPLARSRRAVAHRRDDWRCW